MVLAGLARFVFSLGTDSSSFPLGFAILLMYCAFEWKQVREMKSWRWILASFLTAMIHPLGFEDFFTLSVQLDHSTLSESACDGVAAPLGPAHLPYVFLYVRWLHLFPGSRFGLYF